MTLQETFASYNLRDGQNSLVAELDKFLGDKTACFILKGYAGTGKTFMMKGLTDYLSSNNRSFRIAAPTGRAAKVITQKTKHKAYTIHKTIYSNKNFVEFKVKDEDGTETYKFYYDLKNNEDPTNTVYIIDESSMLSDIYSEGEFFRFGSGYLLRDLIRYINFDNNDHNKKILLIGDNAQLPPIGMNFSPALERKYLEENCGIKSIEFELTEVVRQKAESGILQNATRIRESLQANIFNQLDIITNFQNVIQTKHVELLAKYLQASNNSIDDETIIVAYSNSSVKEYNNLVRKYFFPNQPLLCEGDKVILVRNNYNYPEMELLNGDFGYVKHVEMVSEIRPIKLKRKNDVGKIDEIDIRLSFRNVQITFTDAEDNSHDIDCKIIENLLYSDEPNLSSDEMKAIYIDFKIRHGKQLITGTKEFKDVYRSDPYTNALQIKFGYAITCHKAQGGEWKSVFLNCKTSMSVSNSSYLRWLYTGITRATEILYTLDEPHIKIGSNLQLPKDQNIELLQKRIFIEVSNILKDPNLKIAVKHTSYLEHYTFLLGFEMAVLKFYYNSQNKITKIEQPTNATLFTENIYSVLQCLENKSIVIFEEENIEVSTEIYFGNEKPFLKEFYENITKKIKASKIQILKIEHKNYHEIYEFIKNDSTATYKFHYNAKDIFSKVETNGLSSLIQEINSLII